MIAIRYVCAAFMLSLIRNTKFRENRSDISKVETGRQTKPHDHKSHFIFLVKETRLTNSLVILLCIHAILGAGIAQSL
jgi:hypothetical protein